jgi:hypothetical protein
VAAGPYIGQGPLRGNETQHKQTSRFVQMAQRIQTCDGYSGTLSGRRTSNDSALLNKDGDACCVISCSYCCGQSEHGASRERDGPRRSLRVGVCPFGDTNRNKPRLFFNACMPPCETKSALPHARPLFFFSVVSFPTSEMAFLLLFHRRKKTTLLSLMSFHRTQ